MPLSPFCHYYYSYPQDASCPLFTGNAAVKTVDSGLHACNLTIISARNWERRGKGVCVRASWQRAPAPYPGSDPQLCYTHLPQALGLHCSFLCFLPLPLEIILPPVILSKRLALSQGGGSHLQSQHLGSKGRGTAESLSQPEIHVISRPASATE